MNQKKSWLIKLYDSEINKTGWGECSIIEKLSPDYKNDANYVQNLRLFLSQLQNNNLNLEQLTQFPSIQFGIETALKSLQSPAPFQLFETPFSRGEKGILINGLIWMGEKQFMQEQISQKIKAGFHCLKLKIGAIHFEDEIAMIAAIRKKFPPEKLAIRVDANGAFSFEGALKKLSVLAQYQIHSIEQPIAPKNWNKMAQLCRETPIPIALDEELIGVYQNEDKKALLSLIHPQYLILKPSLVGGFSGASEWIKLAKQNDISWWMTSALEANIGLNAIAQFASTFELKIPQGLGTGSLYRNNIASPLKVKGEKIYYQSKTPWEITSFNQNHV